MGSVRLVAFDLDDTLYPERAFVRTGFRAVSDFLLAEGRAERPLFEAFETAYEAGVRGDTFDRVLAEAGLDPTDRLIRRCIEIYRERTGPGGVTLPALELHPDAARVLDVLAKAGLRRALISDGPLAAQKVKVAALCLEEVLDLIVLTDRWGRAFWKPHPRAFVEVARTAGVAPVACVYVADNPAKDFDGPAAAGWRPSIHIRRPGGVYAHLEPAADGRVAATVETLDDVPDLLGCG